jgi:type VI secretion system protein ImpC
MTESIQKKLLRVRPPRVKITYDVETGGAMEKKELPFIVGILADLKGNREDNATYPPLKTRTLVEIDRDNFNDVMATIAPRVSLIKAKQDHPALHDLLTDPGDNQIVFPNIDAFEPLPVIKALPSLNSMYVARGQVRDLQAKAETNDAIEAQINTIISTMVPGTSDTPTLLSSGMSKWSKDLAGTNSVSAEQSTALLTALVTQLNLYFFKTAAAVDDKLSAVQKTAADAQTATAKAQDAVDQAQKSVDQAKDAADKTKAAADLAKTEADKAKAAADLANTDDAKKLSDDAQTALTTAQTADATAQTALTTATAPLTAAQAALATAQAASDTAQAELLALQANVDAAKAEAKAREDGAKKLTIANARGSVAVIDELIAQIDQRLSEALSTIMHCENFQAMEATWRGLNHLVMNTETNSMLKLRVFNATKDELRTDMMKAVEFDQSTLFKLIYEAEYGTYGGNPYSLLIGDYTIDQSGNDIDFITKISEVAAAANAPFIAQASHKLLHVTGFDQLDKPRDLQKIFDGGDMVEWKAFRSLEDARYVTLVLPRALLRLPYGTATKRNTTPCDALNFDEHIGGDGAVAVYSKTGEALSYPDPEANNFLWGNPAYLLAGRITNAFSLYSWTAAIRGVEGGGLVENLPSYTYTSSNGSIDLFCPTEVSITDRREKELNDLGFITLCHRKGSGQAAFFGGQTTNLPKKYFSDSANANARISSMLPYMLAASRFAHYIKVIMRDKIGSALPRGSIEDYLNAWISNYILLDDNASQEAKASYPLREARVIVSDVPGEPGVYRATVFLKPHFQLEELTTSIRLVADVPK